MPEFNIRVSKKENGKIFLQGIILSIGFHVTIALLTIFCQRTIKKAKLQPFFIRSSTISVVEYERIISHSHVKKVPSKVSTVNTKTRKLSNTKNKVKKETLVEANRMINSNNYSSKIAVKAVAKENKIADIIAINQVEKDRITIIERQKSIQKEINKITEEVKKDIKEEKPLDSESSKEEVKKDIKEEKPLDSESSKEEVKKDIKEEKPLDSESSKEEVKKDIKEEKPLDSESSKEEVKKDIKEEKPLDSESSKEEVKKDIKEEKPLDSESSKEEVKKDIKEEKPVLEEEEDLATDQNITEDKEEVDDEDNENEEDGFANLIQNIFDSNSLEIKSEYNISLEKKILEQILKCWKKPVKNRKYKGYLIINSEFDTNGNLITTFETEDKNNLTQEELKVRRLMSKKANRAIQRCTPLHDMPKDKHKEWRIIRFKFHY